MFLQKQYVRELRLYPIGDLLIDKFAANKQAQWKADKHCRNKAICLDVTNDAVDLLVHVANLIVLTWLLFTKAITVGEFSLLLTNFTTAVNNLQGILSFPVNIWEDGKYIGDIYEVADKEDFVFPRVQQDTQARMVAFKDISYAYNEEPVLKDINIELPLDKKIAIVGEKRFGEKYLYEITVGAVPACKRGNSLLLSGTKRQKQFGLVWHYASGLPYLSALHQGKYSSRRGNGGGSAKNAGRCNQF